VTLTTRPKMNKETNSYYQEILRNITVDVDTLKILKTNYPEEKTAIASLKKRIEDQIESLSRGD